VVALSKMLVALVKMLVALANLLVAISLPYFYDSYSVNTYFYISYISIPPYLTQISLENKIKKLTQK